MDILIEQKLITEMVGEEPYQYYPLGDYIVRAPGICRGRPTFKSKTKRMGKIIRVTKHEVTYYTTNQKELQTVILSRPSKI
jgi:hypothetical protein